MQDLLLAAIALVSVIGIPLTAVVVTRENKRLFESFTRHLESRPQVVGGETEDLAKARIDLEFARLDVQRDETEAKRAGAELDFKVKAARLGLVPPAVDRIETA